MRTLVRLMAFTRPVWKEMLASLLLAAVTIACAIGLMGTSAYLISYAALQPSIAYLQVAVVGVRFFGISRGVFRYLERLISHSVNLRLLAEIRFWLYRKMVPLVPAKTIERRSGDLLALLTADIDTLENLFIRLMAPPLTAILVISGMILFLGQIDPSLGKLLAAGALAGGLILPLTAYFASRKPGHDFILARALMNATLVKSIQSAAEAIAFEAHLALMDRISKVSRDFGEAQMRLARINAASGGVMIWVVNLTSLAVLAGAVRLVDQGELDGVMLAVVTLMTAASFEAVIPLIQTAQQVEPVTAAGKRIFAVTDAEPPVVEPTSPRELPETGGIEFAGLSFRYLRGGAKVLDSIDLSIPQGRRIAVVGPSGSGKSTLVNLLVRTWDYQEGSIKFGGVELRSAASGDAWNRFGIITQNPVILTDTLRRNLQLGDDGVSDDFLVRTLQDAGLKHWYATLPEGLGTWLGERGAKMSAGEQQRLALARLLLKDAPVLIFDEPTANLDHQTEGEILDLILNTASKRTLIWVTHRLVGLERMDEIIFLEKGKITERGSHAALLAQGGRYAQFFEIQQGWLDFEGG